MKTMDELINNIKAIIKSISPLEVFTKVFFFIFKSVVLTVFVTLLTLFIVNYQLFLIITTLLTAAFNYIQGVLPIF